MSTFALVPVGEDTLQAVVDEAGAVHVVVARVCEALGIDTDTQRKRLQSTGWAVHKTSLRPVRDSMGRDQATLTIHLDALPMWLATVEVSRARPGAQAKLQRFQLEARDVLAAHFGMGGRVDLPSPRGSGGAAASGGVPAVRPAAPAGGALEMLAVAKQMMGAIEATLQEVAEVRADVVAVRGELAAANARADDAMALADRVMKKSTAFREDARAIKAATTHVSRCIKRHCAAVGDWRTVYGACRDVLGLARSPASSTTAAPGSPVKQKRPKPIGECIKRADQVLTYARVATRHGVVGCDVTTINRILNADDDANVVDVDTQAVQ